MLFWEQLVATASLHPVHVLGPPLHAPQFSQLPAPYSAQSVPVEHEMAHREVLGPATHWYGGGQVSPFVQFAPGGRFAMAAAAQLVVPPSSPPPDDPPPLDDPSTHVPLEHASPELHVPLG
jgi:hypothetical protein